MLITQAIHNLRPSTEWTLNGEDVENMIWHTENVIPLTTEEVENEIAKLKKQNLVAKAAAQAKLAALGLTTDDLKALGLGGN